MRDLSDKFVELEDYFMCQDFQAGARALPALLRRAVPGIAPGGSG